jgi:CubicO group peptidase (beta-lactamase class C family)
MIDSLSERSGLSQVRLGRLKATLQGYVDRNEVAGAVAVLHRHGVLADIETLGWQDKEARIRMKRNTIFRVASMTKPIVAVATLVLVEEGKIRLSDPVDSWLPELAHRSVMRDPQGSPDDVYTSPRSITLEDLLTYRLGIGWAKSGLESRVFALATGPLADALQITNAERLAPDVWMTRLGALPLIYEPGTRWLYHVASDVLGVLIARITQKPLEVFLRERLFLPLGMKDTSFVVPPEKRRRLAVLYSSNPRGGLAVLDHPMRTAWGEPPIFPSGGGGLVSTADDYLRFARMLLNNGRLDGVRILSRKTVEAMTTDHLTPEQHTHASFNIPGIWSERGFGLGVEMRTKQVGLGPSVGTFSWAGAFGTAWYVDPQEDMIAILLLQLQNAVMYADWTIKICDDFLTMAYQAIAD